MRPSGRQPNELRSIKFTRNFIPYAEGSVLIEYGNTKVICNASFTTGVPRFLKNSGQGWLTAEYGMLPRSTHDRMQREAAQGRQGGRTQEIQRLIGRALRSTLDMKLLKENTIVIDCDVIQADGGTRTAAITGASVALADAIRSLYQKGILEHNPLKHLIAAVSVGIYQGIPVLDLDYIEDSNAETDMNVVMNDAEQFIEVQGTAEGSPFQMQELNSMLELAQTGVTQIVEEQKLALELVS